MLVGFIAVGAALMIVSATFSGAVTRLFTTATAWSLAACGGFKSGPAKLPVRSALH